MKKKAVVLCSGGMDSCVSTAIANEEYELCLLHLNYGQKTENRELQAFHDIADFYNVEKRLVIDTSFLSQIGGSSLTDNSMEIKTGDLDSEEIPNTYVPFRNANILSMAVSWAEVLEARAIFIGAVEEDSSGYPDCRESFYKAFQKMLDLGTKPETNIEIITPLIHLQKDQIVKKGKELNAPLYLSWSCYKSSDEACGICDSCQLRLRGFKKAGFEDPIKYKI
jgi:7-cyano-7-deazaguanine synthase